ncbi:MAG: hypothetical protein FIA94_04125 [Nitrospirae bacterium]|nr:hypothetical protein [Nitrospirota bacterium]
MGAFGAAWGVSGVVLLLASAVYRLSSAALGALSSPWHVQHWVFFLIVVVFMAYAEGYRAFQQRFSPRVAARAKYLLNNPAIVRVVFAPIFCMGFFHATRKRKITSISVTGGIIILVLLVRAVPQPWRGIVDLGVVVGLTWGIISIIIFSVKAFSDDTFAYSPDVPNIR